MSFFLKLETSNYKLNNKMATSLKAFSTMNKRKRMSLFISFHEKGSLTVEAAICLPLFLFFFINLISAIQMIGLQSNLTGAFHQVGKEMAIQGYLYDKAPLSEGGVSWVASIALANTYVKNKVISKTGKEYLENTLISGGANGISFVLSTIMVDNNEKEVDMIDLVGVYQVKPHFSVIPIFPIVMMNRCRVRAWTGYDNTISNDQGGIGQAGEIVYITESGQVYHTSKNCTHITLSIEKTKLNKIENLRNDSGGKYSVCEICGDGEVSQSVYITKTGDRYHISTSCQGLKRTIKSIPIEQVGTRVWCTRCQGG